MKYKRIDVALHLLFSSVLRCYICFRGCEQATVLKIFQFLNKAWMHHFLFRHFSYMRNFSYTNGHSLSMVYFRDAENTYNLFAKVAICMFLAYLWNLSQRYNFFADATMFLTEHHMILFATMPSAIRDIITCRVRTSESIDESITSFMRANHFCICYLMITIHQIFVN